MKNRYYVQPLTEEMFIIRERVSMSRQKGPGPNDHVIRTFTVRHDAYRFAYQMNVHFPRHIVQQGISEHQDAESLLQKV